ncbi:MAG: helix-turn-helix transcriptional regulator [Eubacteriales bacterium]
MLSLTFGEQVKILLSRKNMTIKQLAEKIELKTGMKMSRQNLTQRLGRDNFQEQDMRMIAEILGCSFYLSIMEEPAEETEREKEVEQSQEVTPIEVIEPIKSANERELTIAELEPSLPEEPPLRGGEGDINPYTGYEYKTNSVRSHPSRIGYVQVYDRKDHKWTEMTEWAFLGYQERQKLSLGKSYEEPTYLD